MDVASPPIARSAGLPTLDTSESTLFTLARKFMLAMQAANGWQLAATYRGSHHPSVPGQDHPSP
jgi:hypothetical protein